MIPFFNYQALYKDNEKLKTYLVDISRRREIALQYHVGLKDLVELKLPQAPTNQSDYYDVFQNYELRAKNRDELKKYLDEVGITTIIQWAGSPLI